MSWIGLHTQEAIAPHCTLAHWETLNGIRDAQAYTAILQIIGDKTIPHIICIGVEGRSSFGKTPVWLLDYTNVLTHLRRFVRHLDERSSWTPHVSVSHMKVMNPDPVTFEFEFLGLHTANLRTGHKIHHYWRL